MQKLIPIINFKENEVGNVKIKKVTVKAEKELGFPEAPCKLEEGSFYYSLVEGTNVLMTDLPYERKSHREILKEFCGKILIGGLGLGLFFNYIKNYDFIDVVEKNQNIIDLIWPYYKDKKNVSISCGDIITYQPLKNYDFMYSDILGGVYTDHYDNTNMINKYKNNVNIIKFWEL